MTSSTTVTSFPGGFLWGAATSAYQIEGGVELDERGASIWDTFSAQPGAVVGGDNGAVAADHLHRYREDVALMADLQLRMYRFSVAWPRIQPDGRGPANQKGLDFYRRLVDELLSNGIRPNLSLYHWDLPQALQDRGGWANRETAYRFAEYAEIVYRDLRDRVSWWSTINEPWCVTLLGYASGIHAPGVRDPGQAIRAIHHVLLGHGLAVKSMRAIDPGPRHAIVLNLAPVRTVVAAPDAAMRDAVRTTDGYRNRIWLEPLFRGTYPADMQELTKHFGGLPVEPGDMEVISTPLDWLGINYYNDTFLAPDATATASTHPGVDGVRDVIPGPDRTDMDWPISPDGLRDLLVSVGRDYPTSPPMIVTENGAAYDDPVAADGSIDDSRRIRYIGQHLRAISEAIAAGADVRGYLVWSLLDNFEWAEGYARRFGIVHVDYPTQLRIPRRSAAWYRAVIERNGVLADDAA